MPIRIARGTEARICDHSDGFAIQVLHPSDLGAAVAAFRRVRADIVALTAGRQPRDGVRRPSVSEVVAAPGGPLLVADHLDVPYEKLRSIPELVVRRLDQAGLDYGTLVAPERGGVLDGLDTAPNAVVLRLFPTPRGPDGIVPPAWLDAAADWVLGDLGPEDKVRMRILGVEFDVGVTEASAVLYECAPTRTWCDIVQGDLGHRIRSASITFGRLPHLAVAAGGPGVDSRGLISRFELLGGLARELAADVAYACVDFEPTFEGLALGLSPDGWRRQGGAPPNVVAGELIDEWVPDAFPYQVLGPGHVARLRVDDLADAQGLPGGRLEVAIGVPGEWLPTASARYDMLESGWEALAPCLLEEHELAAVLATRGDREAPAAPPGTSGAGSFDLDAVELERHPHPRRGMRLSVLELAAWLSHEPHTDEPASVSEPLATFLRWWAAGLDHETRQRLKPYAAAIIGTGMEPRHDESRRWAAVEWLVRVQAPAWLRLGGLADAAERLEAVGSLRDNTTLVRAVDLLGSAVKVASRRIDVTNAIAGDLEDDDAGADQYTWDAWDQVSERSAWVAASEAATHGAPPDLTYATDLRVIECSRDPHVRDEIEAAGVTVGDTTWATALHALSTEAWDRAWRAADAASKELSGLVLRDQIERLTRAAAPPERLGRDLPEATLEVADQAARDELTRAALRAGTPENGQHPWDAARQTARSSSAGPVWAVVMDEARQLVGEDAWAQAMADARSATEKILRDAPDLVGRAVAAAVAPEAASAAARSVASRAVAVARANGAGDEEAAAAALASLTATADQLTEAAFVLLDRLIDPSAPVPGGDVTPAEDRDRAPAVPSPGA